MMKKVLEYQRQLGLITDGDRIVAGFSGGADSVCLLLVLEELKKQYDFSFCGVHVEHGIRGEESEADAVFAESFCQERGIPFYLYHVNAPAKAKMEGISLEEAARKLRYECFEQARAAYDATKVAVAHHGDDNAETMLFHMIRGTGVHGMTGIRPERGQIIRPLLCVTRAEIEAFLASQQVSYCVDSTNGDVTYSRNRIRSQVMPQLLKINPRAVEHMTSLSQQVEELYDYVSRSAWEAGKGSLKLLYGGVWLTADEPTDSLTIPAEIRIAKGHVAAMEPVLQKEFLHQVLGLAAGSKKDIGAVHVVALRQLFFAETGKQSSLPYGLAATVGYEDVVLAKEQEKDKDGGRMSEKLVCHRSLEDILKASVVLENGLSVTAKILDFDGDLEKIPEKRYTKWFDYDKIKGTVLLRKRVVGDYLIINQKGNRKKLKEYFIHEKISREQREQTWLLAEDSHIIWIIGHRISEGYKVTTDTKQILEVRVEKEN